MVWHRPTTGSATFLGLSALMDNSIRFDRNQGDTESSLLTMLTTDTDNSTLRLESTSFQRLLLTCVLPVLLLLIAAPLAQRFTPAAVGRQVIAKEVGLLAADAGEQAAHRRAAMRTLQQLESKASFGAPKVTLPDLERLQNALE